MFTTTLAAIALAGGISSGVIPSTPNWHTDYAQALTRSSAVGKPMAVFIGNGADRVAKMMADGTISAEAALVLNFSYVCVYLDANTETGKDLAGRFEIAEGLIISSRGGNLQAYRHSGAIGSKESDRFAHQVCLLRCSRLNGEQHTVFHDRIGEHRRDHTRPRLNTCTRRMVTRIRATPTRNMGPIRPRIARGSSEANPMARSRNGNGLSPPR